MKPKTTTLVVVLALMAGIVGYAWWRSPRAEESTRGSIGSSPRAARSVDRSEFAASAHTHGNVANETSGTDAPLPPWEERLNRLISLVGKVPDAELDMAIADLAASLPHEDALAVLDLQLLPDADGMPLVSRLCMLLFDRWSTRAPAEAAQWLTKAPDTTFTQRAHENLARVWSDTELNEAIAWWRSLPEHGGKAAARFIIAESAADKHETGVAIELLSPLPASAERDRLLHFAARQWATTDRAAALAWTEAQPDPVLRAKTLAALALDLSVSDPATAANLVLNVPAGKHQEHAVANIARFWTVDAPEQAAAWAENLPESPVRAVALEGIAETWARENIDRAAAWLNQLVASPSRDAAVGAFATVVAKSSPDSARRWADTIQDPSRRAAVHHQLGAQ